jgi:protein phosphatase
MFEFYKGPIDGSLPSDIDSFDYLFLGNYVDRGKFSLETICVLMSLKVKFPTQVHLLRGYHEIKSVNMEYGLANECQMRLGENINDPSSIFQEINSFFNYLPLAAIVDETIICVHSGIGSMKSIEPINLLKRPLEAINDGSVGTKALMDILCSNPSDGIESMDTERDITNPMKCGSYTSEAVDGFLKASSMQLLIRSHQTVIEGFTACCNNKVMSITSSTDYCGQLKNTACILVIKKTLEVVPKVLMPMEGWSSKCWNQDDELLKKRPPTPPLRIV